MQVKLFEVRDRMTFIPVVCVAFDWASEDPAMQNTPQEGYLIRRCGYGPRVEVLMTKLQGGEVCHYDPNSWSRQTRTMPAAHTYICDHWHELQSGQVIDVEFILGETSEPKQSERVTA